jgi:oxygen tolerance protein BatD
VRHAPALPLVAAFLVATALATLPAAAQDQVQVRALVDRSEIGEGEDLRLVVEVSGPSLDKVGPPDMSDLGDFDISGGPSVSTRYQWINGVSTASKSWTYLLTPRKTGKVSIPELRLLVDGHTFRTRSVDVNVVPHGAVRSPYQPTPPTRPGPPGIQPTQPREPQRGRGSLPPVALRVRAEVDSAQAYVGQQITLKVVLATQTEVLNAGPADNAEFPGFWAEEIKLPERPDVRRVVYDGEPWTEITLMKRALFPTTAGALTIPPVAWQIQVRRRSSDPLESFFFTPTETVTRRSDPIKINVLPLPAAGRPAGFSGAVGHFDLAVTADRDAARVNDAVGLKVRVWGEGALSAVAPPTLPEIADFKRFEPKVTSSQSVTGDRMRAEKIWDYVVIPLAPGTPTIPAIAFSYFDPRDRQYHTASSRPLSVKVDRAEPGAMTGAPVVAQSDVRLLRRDIRSLKQATGGLVDRSRPFYRSPFFVLLVLLPFVADAGVWAWARTRDVSPAAARSRRERRARSVARRRLRQARRALAPASARAFYASVAQSLTDYIGDKFGMPGAGLTQPRIEELLAAHGAPDDLRAAFHRTLETCDFARFAPASSGVEEMRQALREAEETLIGLERSLQR